jgi:hydrogenase nickel incorporation protein HypA/HybF
MHELSIALSILDVAEEEAERRGLTVTGIHLKLGPLAGVSNDALLSAFELAREASPLATANLVIEEVPIRAVCPKCECERPVESIQMLRCVICGTPTGQIVSGRELEIVALESL